MRFFLVFGCDTRLFHDFFLTSSTIWFILSCNRTWSDLYKRLLRALFFMEGVLQWLLY